MQFSAPYEPPVTALTSKTFIILFLTLPFVLVNVLTNGKERFKCWADQHGVGGVGGPSANPGFADGPQLC